MPKIGAHRRHDPHRATACERIQQTDKDPALLRPDRGDGEQFFELIDHEDELGLFEGEDFAVAASGVRYAADGPGKQKRRGVGRCAQMSGELLCVLTGTKQFGQSKAFVGGPTQQSLDKSHAEDF